MENSSINPEQARTSAKDFFLHLGSIVALYVVAGNFINLLFKIINEAFPEVASYSYYYFQTGSQISLPTATLIIVFPVFVLLSRMVHKTYEESPEKKNLAIRKWLTYITLFVAGIMLVGDLVMVLYKFLDGQDLTAAFLLKALVVLLVSGAVFGFYLRDIRDGVSQGARNLWSIVVGLLILFAIVLGFSVLGSPATQRLMREDNQKIMDLQNIQWQIINNWQLNGLVHDTWPDIEKDPQTGAPYEYRKTGDMSFELCAVFNKESQVSASGRQPMMADYSMAYPMKGGLPQSEDWSHPAGKHCFQRTIDPVIYPTSVRG